MHNKVFWTYSWGVCEEEMMSTVGKSVCFQCSEVLHRESCLAQESKAKSCFRRALPNELWLAQVTVLEVSVQ